MAIRHGLLSASRRFSQRLAASILIAFLVPVSYGQDDQPESSANAWIDSLRPLPYTLREAELNVAPGGECTGDFTTTSARDCGRTSGEILECQAGYYCRMEDTCKGHCVRIDAKTALNTWEDILYVTSPRRGEVQVLRASEDEQMGVEVMVHEFDTTKQFEVLDAEVLPSTGPGTVTLRTSRPQASLIFTGLAVLVGLQFDLKVYNGVVMRMWLDGQEGSSRTSRPAKLSVDLQIYKVDSNDPTRELYFTLTETGELKRDEWGRYGFLFSTSRCRVSDICLINQIKVNIETASPGVVWRLDYVRAKAQAGSKGATNEVVDLDIVGRSSLTPSQQNSRVGGSLRSVIGRRWRQSLQASLPHFVVASQSDGDRRRPLARCQPTSGSSSAVVDQVFWRGLDVNYCPAGTSRDALLGHVWIRQGVGSVPLQRASREQGMAQTYPLPPTSADARRVNMGVFAYPFYRFWNNDSVSLHIGNTRVVSRKAAGGAIFEYWYKDTQFINTHDLGRELQSAMFYLDQSDNMRHNPTEAGGEQVPLWRTGQEVLVGSPNVVAFNVDTTQVTLSLPNEWNYMRVFRRRRDYPLTHAGIQLGKEITLNFLDMDGVSKYVTNLYLPLALPRIEGTSRSELDFYVEVPTAYLRGRFNRFFTYDAPKKQLDRISLTPYDASKPPTEWRRDFIRPAFGGVIISDEAERNALGVYGASTSQGGSVEYFQLWNFLQGSQQGTFDAGTTKWSAVYRTSGGMKAGSYRFTTYVVAGALQEVQDKMNALYELRDSIPR